MSAVKYLSYEGLQKYDELIKSHITNQTYSKQEVDDMLEYAVFTDDTVEGEVDDVDDTKIGGEDMLLSASRYVVEDNEKTEKISQVRRYAKSMNVNVFYLNDLLVLISDKVLLRMQLYIQSAMYFNDFNNQDTTLTIGNQIITKPCLELLDMLYQIARYCCQCDVVTKTHITNIDELPDEEVATYDYSTGYPEVLHF